MTLSSQTIHQSHPSQPQSRLWNIASMLYILGVHWSVFNWTQRRPRSSGSGPTPVWNIYSTQKCLHVGTFAIKPTSVVRDLGVLLDSKLSMRQHIGKLKGLCYYHLRRLKKIWRILGHTITCRLVSAFVSSSLDYCNSTLAGLPKFTIAHQQRIQNAAVRLLCSLGSREHVTKSLHELHWQPIRFRIMYKLCLMMHHVHARCSPGYKKETITPTAGLAHCSRLRSSASTNYELPALHHKIGEWAFSYAGPASWNSLLNERRSISDTTKFKTCLKTHLKQTRFTHLTL